VLQKDKNPFLQAGLFMVCLFGIIGFHELGHLLACRKYNLDFTLLSDQERRIVRAYGVESPFKTAKRVTYIIGPDGIIKHVFASVNTKNHASDVLKRMEELKLA
jgi:peroxiredoxin Q/BCP